MTGSVKWLSTEQHCRFASLNAGERKQENSDKVSALEHGGGGGHFCCLL